jgi:clan AA aspartic protease
LIKNLFNPEGVMLLPVTKFPGESKMGLTHVAVQIRNRETTDTFSANFLVDTGATDSMVPACELVRIGIKPNHKKTYELANGELAKFDVAYAVFSFMDETIESRVIFGPDNAEPILCVLALEAIGVVVDPSSQKLKKLPALPLKMAV